MARANAVTWSALILGLAGSCQPVLGGVDVTWEQAPPEQEVESEGVALPPPPVSPVSPVSPAAPPEVVRGQPAPVLAPRDAGPPERSDAGALGPPEAEPDAALPATQPRAVLVEAASDLERVGIAGGGPRLGVCVGGVAIGVRPTANPSLNVFGQRLTFLEPVCGRVSLQPAGTPDEPSRASLTVVRDDAIVSWEVTAPFQGTPPTEVPDSRLIWVLQPATLCPGSAPVLVGLSGDMDPMAPDASDTDVLRSLVIECAPLVVASNGSDVGAAGAGHQFILQADSFGTSGTATYRSACDGGSVVSRIRIDSGYWLDGFVLGCSRLRSP